MTRKLMYYAGDHSEQMVWLVWELKNGRPVLGVICTTDSDLARYVTADKTAWLSGGAVACEKVLTDHLYGSTDMVILRRLLRAMP